MFVVGIARVCDVWDLGWNPAAQPGQKILISLRPRSLMGLWMAKVPGICASQESNPGHEKRGRPVCCRKIIGASSRRFVFVVSWSRSQCLGCLT